MQSLPSSDLRKYITLIRDNSIDVGQLTDFIYLTKRVALSYIRNFRGDAARLLKDNGLSVNDLAFDCIAEIFVEGMNGKFHLLHQFLERLQPPLDEIEASDLSAAFFSIVKRVTDVNIARIFCQFDPFGSKLSRNLKDSLRRGGRFTARNDFRGNVLSLVEVDSVDHLPEYPIDKLERDLSLRVKSRSRVPELLDTLAEILSSQSEYRRSLPINDVVLVLKQFYKDSVEDDFLDGSFVEDDVLSQLDFEILSRQVEKVISEKIVSTYLLKGKLNKEEAKGLYHAVLDVVNEWMNDDDPPESPYMFLRKYLPMTREEYEAGWRTKLEYLVRIAKEAMRQLIES